MVVEPPLVVETLAQIWIMLLRIMLSILQNKLNETITCLAILCDLFGMAKCPFQRLSDLQLGDEKVTLNHLV